MRFSALFIALMISLPLIFAAEFSITPYLYVNEKNSTVTYATFSTGNNSTAKLASINGEEAILLIDGKIITDKAVISSTITTYYTTQFYPSDADMAELKGFALAFNKSRNALTKYGQAEKVCYEQGTFLAHKPCSDMTSCMATASLVCTISGAEGCTVDLLATHILAYSKGITALNAAYSKFITGFNGFGPTTVAASLDQMDAAFNDMKTAGTDVSKSKLIYPETYACSDCLGICPEPKFDYASITSGKAKIASLRTKTAPFSNMGKTVEKVALSTTDRIAYKEGEEKAAIYVPRYDSAKAKFGGLKAQAVLAKSLAADSDFVSAADAFISKSDSIENAVDKRKFDGFDALLLSYENTGSALASVINNSTDAYYRAIETQDNAGDLLLQAMWKANGASQSVIDGYNALGARKLALDSKFSPPMAKTAYDSLAQEYSALAADVLKFTYSSNSPTDSVFAAGNKLERTSVDGAMTLASSFVPISFNTRQSIARYIPPIVLGVIDISILAVALAVFAGVFYHFHGFFRSKLAISGWVLTAVGFVFVLLIGSVGFYGIVMSAEKYATFSDFFGAATTADRVAVIVRETGADSEAVAGMHACAEQIRTQMALSGKKTIKYYIDGGDCHSFMPVSGSTSLYDETTGLLAETCLDSMPDVPVFDLRYSAENQPPAFTSVVVKQAIFKGNTAYYSKKPMCDAANVLG
ncbi:MAG: hypothetical protein WCT52_05540 [Candidatus Micrarchaeia archaeon]